MHVDYGAHARRQRRGRVIVPMRERRELGCGGEPLLGSEPPALGRIVQRSDRPRVRDQITGAIRAPGKGRKGLVVVTKTPQAI